MLHFENLSQTNLNSCHNVAYILMDSCSFQVLVCRNYRGDVDMSEIEHFMSLLMDKEEEGTLSPILAHGGVRFMWIKHNNLYCILTVHNIVFTPRLFSVYFTISSDYSRQMLIVFDEMVWSHTDNTCCFTF